MRKLNLSDIAFDRLKKLPATDSGIIRFPIVFHKLCSSLQITKENAWYIIMELEKENRIEIVPNNGIRVADDCR